MAGGADVHERFDLEGRVAVVTGAGTHLARAAALALAEGGCDLVAVGRRREPLEATAAEVEALGRRCLVRPADVTQSEEVDSMVAEAQAHFGRIDILVNGAGGSEGGMGEPIQETSDELWYRGLDQNVSSAFFCTRAAIPFLVEAGGGSIVNVSGGWAIRGARNFWSYSVAKAGLMALTRVTAVSHARDGIRAHCVAPGFFPHGMAEEQVAAIGAAQPVGRTGRPEEFGALVRFLVSDAAGYVSGETVYLDGGVLTAGVLPLGFEPAASRGA
jgi:NAD(P)-dependent dehydrogenase (short-subunit alcohol dehydrogenase family)